MIRGIEPTYNELLIHFPPRTIETEEAYEGVLSEMERLLAKQSLSSAEKDFLSLLSTLVQVYEETHYPVSELGSQGVKLLRGLIELHESPFDELLSIFGTRSALDETLRRERPLTLLQIDALAHYFELPHQHFFESVPSLIA